MNELFSSSSNVPPPSDHLSISSMDFYERNQLVNSPRSLYACRKEGILPSDLLYRPLEAFVDNSIPGEIVRLRYEYRENRRRELIGTVRKRR